MMKMPDALDIFACPLEGMTLVEASAGTGKTWNICALYLRLLLEAGRTVPEILVVTFTTAATAELKERIRSRIMDTMVFLEADGEADRAAFAAADPFLLMLDGWMAARGEDARTMHATLQAALMAFDEAAIFTIHGFCQKALAARAFSAGQAFSATVEPDDVEIITEVANDFWRRYVASGEISHPLLRYLHAKGVTPEIFRDFLIREFKKPLAKKIWPKEIHTPAESEFPALVKAFEAMRQCWQKEAPVIRQLLADAAESQDLSKTYYGPDRIGNVFLSYTLLFQERDALALSISDDLFPRLTSEWIKEKGTRKGKTPPAHPFFDLAGEWLDLRREALAQLALAFAQLLFRLQEEADTVRERKQERQVMSYDDMLFNLQDALADENFPGLAQAIRQVYPAALIDEFQDTDPVQFSIFDAIYAGTGAPVFLVGDPKQAIYSFRNADLHTYLHAKGQVAREFSLTHNQRSTPRLIAACNAFFGKNEAAFMMEGLAYQPVVAGERKREVLSDQTLAKGETADGMVLWQLPGGDGGGWLLRREAQDAAAAAVADEIARLLNAAAEGTITIGERPLAAADMAVLVHSHREGTRVQQALAGRGIASVSLAQESVWYSPDADELHLVLSAVLQPRNPALLKAALATEMLGFDASEIARLSADETESLAWVERFTVSLSDWQNGDIGLVLRRLMAKLGVYARLLQRPDGERRLTNLLHLAELLQEAAQIHQTPEALMRWFEAQQRESKPNDDTQLRLESDENLVQILTIHRAKGLEFPFVFCPFLWDAYQINRSDALPGLSYHDGDTLVIDFREPDAETAAQIRRQARMERAAENLRVLYVALTRAVFRCYVVSGAYLSAHGSGSPNESARGLLNWLAAGNGVAPEAWLTEGDARYKGDSKKKVEDQRLPMIDAAWATLAQENEGIALKALPAGQAPVHLLALGNGGDAPALRPAPVPGKLAASWRIGSYSALMAGAAHEASGGDYDEMAQAAQPDAPEVTILPDDILLFPAQRFAGNCLHAVFEEADFTDERTWDAAIEKALFRHPPQGQENAEGALAVFRPMVRRMLADVLATPLADGLQLADVALEKRLTELEFFLPVKQLSASRINALLVQRYPMPQLSFHQLDGYLKGFIDLVFEHDGRFYILDWKSNRLGMGAADYGQPGIAAAMAEHGYHLQYLLYTLALHRYLAARMPDYDYGQHMGGVFYLFVRGVRPEWKQADGSPSGVFFHRAEEELIQTLDAIFRDGEEAA